MNICKDCETLQQNYNDLYWKYDNLLDKYHKLKEEYNKTCNKLDSANFKINTELEPRIKNEQRNYDGMSGKCGYECSIFGNKSECFENITTEEQILDTYENYINTGYILDLIKEYGLEDKAKWIDKEILRKQMGIHQREIDKLYKELLNISKGV